MNIGIIGCAGRMGRILTATVLETDGAELAGGTEQANSQFIGEDVATLAGCEPRGTAVGENPMELFEVSGAVVDFTAPAGTVGHARLAAESGTALVIGTTGLDAADMDAIKIASKKTTIVQASNMSLGVNLLLGLVETVARSLGEEYDIEIVEMHHRHKADAPSGTALMLGEAAARGRGVELNAVSERVRDGRTGARVAGKIGFANLRGGDVVGEHTVILAGPGERVELTHRAADRSIFARGAIRAALWTKGKDPGLYNMRDVLGVD